MTTVGEALVAELKARGVDLVFGIPGVHTVELYRGLAGSGIRHVTPRHEQGAGFMADGYARVSGRPGVAFVITGPGVTNTLTPMGQARADSVPMLVVSGVNARPTLGRGFGHLHELPDQRAMTALVALSSDRIEQPEDLSAAIGRAYAGFATDRPGPRHIEVPTDVMALPAVAAAAPAPFVTPRAGDSEIARATGLLAKARTPLILAGGGAKFDGRLLQDLAERLDAPVVQTVNARGLMHGHALTVPASPSLEPIRQMIRDADVVLAVGTEFGPTDYEAYGGKMPRPACLIRIDISDEQLSRRPSDVALQGHAGTVLPGLLAALPERQEGTGAVRADAGRKTAWAALDPAMQGQIRMLEAVRDTCPDAIFVGDSTQAVYSGNLYYDHDRPAGWFNAATGFGALGYAIPASIGAALACPGIPVICLAGDGGAQFSLPEIMTAVDEKLPVTFLIWNNRAYHEIAVSMERVGVGVTGCHPTPPDFAAVAASCGIPHERVPVDPKALSQALKRHDRTRGPALIEIDDR